MKICTKCSIEKSEDKFYKSGKNKLSSQCGECCRQKKREQYYKYFDKNKKKCLSCDNIVGPESKTGRCLSCRNRGNKYSVGYVYTKEQREKRSLSKIGDKNPMWKGNDVSYGALHDYIKWHLPKPELCEKCKLPKKLDLANISNKYLRDLSDWEWLCRKCHMTKDGRLEKLTRKTPNSN